jgi:PAS domain S-box-containing protein
LLKQNFEIGQLVLLNRYQELYDYVYRSPDNLTQVLHDYEVFLQQNSNKDATFIAQLHQAQNQLNQTVNQILQQLQLGNNKEASLLLQNEFNTAASYFDELLSAKINELHPSVSQREQAVTDLSKSSQELLLLGGIGAGVLAIFLALALSLLLSRRFVKLEQAVVALGQGDFAVRVPQPGNDQIGRVGTAFNKMVELLNTLVSERKHVEEALQRERDFNAAVLDTAGSLVVVLDRQGCILLYNRACERTNGYLFAEVKTKCFWELFAGAEEVEQIKQVFSYPQVKDFPYEFEGDWLTKEGEKRLITWSTTALLDNAGAVGYVIATGIDITARKQAEELRLEQAKLKMLLVLAGEAAHKLSQPLTALQIQFAIMKEYKQVAIDNTQLMESIEEMLGELTVHIREYQRIVTDSNAKLALSNSSD